MAAELFHADGQTDTDITNLIVAFRNFANSPNEKNTAPLLQFLTN